MRTVLLLFLILASSMIKAQDYAINWSKSKKKSSITATINVIGLEGEHYYYIQTQKYKATITKRNKNHEEVDEQVLSIKNDKAKALFEEVIETRSGRYLYFRSLGNKGKSWHLLVSEFKDGQAGELKKIHEFPSEISIHFTGIMGNVANYPLEFDRYNKVMTSPDKSHVGFMNPLSVKKGEEKIALAVFDDKMNLVWSKTQDFGHEDKAFFITQSAVDNKGNLYILARMTKKSQGGQEGKYKLFIVNKDDFKEFDLQLEGDVTAEALIFQPSINKTSDFVITGFYANKNAKKGYKGVVYAKGNTTGFTKVIMNDFDDMSNKISSSIDKDNMENFNMIRAIDFNDGTISVIAERFDGQSLGEAGAGLSSKDLVVICFSETGEVTTFKGIHKYMSEDYSTALPTLVHVQNDNIYLVFNNTIDKKQPRKKNGKINRGRRQSTDLVIISKDGKEVLNKELFTSSEKDMTLLSYLSDANTGEILLGCWDVNKFAYGLIKL